MKDIFSMLGIDPGLGVVGAERAKADVSRDAVTFDLMKKGASRKPAAELLLGEDLWALMQQVSDQGVEKISFRYAVEKLGFTPGYNEISDFTFNYESVKASQVTYILDEGERARTALVTGAEASDSLRAYAGHTNSRVRLGHAGEMHHLNLIRNGPNLRQVFLRMWLMHLDVLAGAQVSVRVDNVLTRQHLPADIAIEDECEFAKRLSGVRVHVNSLDDTSKALLVYACGLSDGEGASARISRYVWEPIHLTFYGGIMPVAREVLLTDASATGRAIVAFAERYGQMADCGEALRMALHMYGTVTSARKMTIRLGIARLHQQTHQKQLVRANYRCQELGCVELVSLAMLVGEGVDSALGHSLHAAVRMMNLRDTPMMYVYLEPRARMIKDAAEALGLRAWLSDFFVESEYVRRNLKQLYAKEGVMHAMALGLVVRGSLVEEASEAFEVPARIAGGPTDDVQTASEQMDRASAWLLLNHMLNNGLASVGCTRAALARIADPDEQLDEACSGYAGARVRMALVGFGGSITLRRVAQTSFALQPTAPEVPVETVVKSDDDALQTRMSEGPANADAKDWLATLLAQRGPLASTTTRRGNVSVAVQAAHYGPAEVRVAAVPEELEQSLDTLVERGWGELDTSGENLECGANALHQSLAAHGAATGEHVPNRDDVLTAMRSALSPAQREIARQAGVDIGRANFTADQMAAALQQFGPYRLAVIHGPPEAAEVMGIGDGEPIYVRHYGQHWSGIGPGGRRVGRRLPSGTGT
uniref:Putative coat protein n=1 Tax=Alphachrysovirus aspergilli TaxID=607716 RepID=A0A679AXD3_9VIRU|nr:putative coat protein [Alphachrysovirus aspergilli]